MKRKFTDDQELQICDEYFSEEKPSTVTLGKKLGCSHTLIGDAIIRNGYTLRARGETLKSKKPWNKGIVYPKEINRKARIFTKEQEQQICNEYFSEEKPSTKTLAKRWNCSSLTIEHVIVRSGYKVRTKSESHKGKKVWNDGLTKETNESVKQMSELLKDRHPTEKTKQKMSKSHEGQIPWNKDRKSLQPAWNKNLTKETDERVKSISDHCKGRKAWNKNIPHSNDVKEKISRKASTPKRIQQSLRNSHGKKCYYDNEFFPSLQERDCYIELIKFGFKVKHNFEKRFDFLVLINNKRVVVEFHPFDFKLTDKQYYTKRRKLLNEYGYKDLKLIVIKDLKEIENKLGNEI